MLIIVISLNYILSTICSLIHDKMANLRPKTSKIGQYINFAELMFIYDVYTIMNEI